MALSAGSECGGPLLERVSTDLNIPHFSRSLGGFHAHLLTAWTRSCCPFSTGLTHQQYHDCQDTYTHCTTHGFSLKPTVMTCVHLCRRPARSDRVDVLNSKADTKQKHTWADRKSFISVASPFTFLETPS